MKCIYDISIFPSLPVSLSHSLSLLSTWPSWWSSNMTKFCVWGASYRFCPLLKMLPTKRIMGPKSHHFSLIFFNIIPFNKIFLYEKPYVAFLISLSPVFLACFFFSKTFSSTNRVTIWSHLLTASYNVLSSRMEPLPALEDVVLTMLASVKIDQQSRKRSARKNTNSIPLENAHFYELKRLNT